MKARLITVSLLASLTLMFQSCGKVSADETAMSAATSAITKIQDAFKGVKDMDAAKQAVAGLKVPAAALKTALATIDKLDLGKLAAGLQGKMTALKGLEGGMIAKITESLKGAPQDVITYVVNAVKGMVPGLK